MEITSLFTKFVKDWFEGALSTEDLSSLANFFLSKLENKDSELAVRLMDASELSYYVRNPSKDNGQPLYGFVARLREFQKMAEQ